MENEDLALLLYAAMNYLDGVKAHELEDIAIPLNIAQKVINARQNAIDYIGMSVFDLEAWNQFINGVLNK